MFRTLVLSVVAMGAIGVGDAAAMSITLTSPAVQTVVRPASGTIEVDWTGTITLDQGFSLFATSQNPLLTVGGTALAAGEANPTFKLTGTLFEDFVASTDALGLYDVASDKVTPTFLKFTECLGTDCNSASVDYGINVVDSLPTAVPEPASMLLLGTGLIGMGARRWRTRRQRS